MFNGHTKEVYLSIEGPVFADHVNNRDAYSIIASRAKFRNWLIHDIEVNWGYTFDKYEILPDGRVKVHFENGASVEGDILIGADGSPSKGILFFLCRVSRKCVLTPTSIQFAHNSSPPLSMRTSPPASCLYRWSCSLPFP